MKTRGLVLASKMCRFCQNFWVTETLPPGLSFLINSTERIPPPTRSETPRRLLSPETVGALRWDGLSAAVRQLMLSIPSAFLRKGTRQANASIQLFSQTVKTHLKREFPRRAGFTN